MDLTRQPPPLRAFSSAPSALDMDFAAAPTPQLITGVLRACAADEPDEQELWALPVGVRLQWLLGVLAAEGERALWAQLRCANDACGEAIEIDLAPAELVAFSAGRAETVVSVDVDGRRVGVRLPTGAEQLAWQNRRFTDEREARFAVVADLTGLEPASLDEALADSVEAALADADPLVSFELEVVCPYCQERRTYEVDLVELALARFRERQEWLLADVHVLASHYHWTEADILAVPAERRARYLALIDPGSG